MEDNGQLPDELLKDGPRIIRLLNVKLTVQAIYFIKTRRTIATAGLDKESGKWLAAVLHFETHKIIFHTSPVFKNKHQAIEFCNELIFEARRTKIS